MPESGEGAGAGWRATDLFTVVFEQVWTDTARSPTSCCRRPRSWSTTSWRAATARCVFQRARPVVPAGGRGAPEPRGVRRAGPASGPAARGRSRGTDGADRRPAGEHARRAAPARGARARRPRRAGVRRDAGAVRRRLSADARPQDPSLSPRRSIARRRTASTSIGPIPRRRRLPARADLARLQPHRSARPSASCARAGADRAGARRRRASAASPTATRARVERARRGALSGRGEPRPAAGRRRCCPRVWSQTHRMAPPRTRSARTR